MGKHNRKVKGFAIVVVLMLLIPYYADQDYLSTLILVALALICNMRRITIHTTQFTYINITIQRSKFFERTIP